MEVAQIHQDQLDRIKETVRKAHEVFRHNYERFIEFRKFIFECSLSENDITLLTTLSKPQLEFNITEAYISRLMGEFSKQEPSISVSAEDETVVDQLTAEVVEKHLRHIMFDTKNNSTQYEVMKDLYSGGFSVFKIWTDYKNEKSFDQDLFVDRVYDPTLVGWDMLANKAHKGDGNFCFELFPMSHEDFVREYPDVNISSVNFRGGFGSFNWSYLNGNERIILVCDFYEKKRRKVKIVKLSSGQVLTTKEYEKMKAKWGEVMQFPTPVGKPRTSEITTIVRYRLISNQVLEYVETDFSFFPLVFVDGNSVLIRNTKTGGSVYQMTRPYVYHAKGAQKLKNFAGISLANEIENMIQHKIIIAKEALPKEENWLEAYRDVQKPNVFVYNAFNEQNPDQVIPNPIREVNRIAAPPELMAAYQSVDGTIQQILGSYDASLGINDNQLSGVAIQEGATQSNAAAMPYIVGYLHGWQRVGEILVDLMPKYYRTPRTIPIMGIDGKRDYIQINGGQNGQGQGQGMMMMQSQPSIDFRFSPNALNVRIEAGVSFQIQKSKALQQMISLMQVSPLFAQFINEKGLPVLLDNLEIRGIESLKMMVEQWMQELAQQKAMMMQAQQQQMQNNPAVMKNQIEMQKLQLQSQKQGHEMQKSQVQFLIDQEKLRTEQQKALVNALASHNANQVQMIKAETERYAKQADMWIKHMGMRMHGRKAHFG